jgi:hypothetical protein
LTHSTNLVSADQAQQASLTERGHGRPGKGLVLVNLDGSRGNGLGDDLLKQFKIWRDLSNDRFSH